MNGQEPLQLDEMQINSTGNMADFLESQNRRVLDESVIAKIDVVVDNIKELLESKYKEHSGDIYELIKGLITDEDIKQEVDRVVEKLVELGVVGYVNNFLNKGLYLKKISDDFNSRYSEILLNWNSGFFETSSFILSYTNSTQHFAELLTLRSLTDQSINFLLNKDSVNVADFNPGGRRLSADNYKQFLFSIYILKPFVDAGILIKNTDIAGVYTVNKNLLRQNSIPVLEDNISDADIKTFFKERNCFDGLVLFHAREVLKLKISTGNHKNIIAFNILKLNNLSDASSRQELYINYLYDWYLQNKKEDFPVGQKREGVDRGVTDEAADKGILDNAIGVVNSNDVIQPEESSFNEGLKKLQIYFEREIYEETSVESIISDALKLKLTSGVLNNIVNTFINEGTLIRLDDPLNVGDIVYPKGYILGKAKFTKLLSKVNSDENKNEKTRIDDARSAYAKLLAEHDYRSSKIKMLVAGIAKNLGRNIQIPTKERKKDLSEAEAVYRRLLNNNRVEILSRGNNKQFVFKDGKLCEVSGGKSGNFEKYNLNIDLLNYSVEESEKLLEERLKNKPDILGEIGGIKPLFRKFSQFSREHRFIRLVIPGLLVGAGSYVFGDYGVAPAVAYGMSRVARSAASSIVSNFVGSQYGKYLNRKTKEESDLAFAKALSGITIDNLNNALDASLAEISNRKMSIRKINLFKKVGAVILTAGLSNVGVGFIQANPPEFLEDVVGLHKSYLDVGDGGFDPVDVSRMKNVIKVNYIDQTSKEIYPVLRKLFDTDDTVIYNSIKKTLPPNFNFSKISGFEIDENGDLDVILKDGRKFDLMYSNGKWNNSLSKANLGDDVVNKSETIVKTRKDNVDNNSNTIERDNAKNFPSKEQSVVNNEIEKPNVVSENHTLEMGKVRFSAYGAIDTVKSLKDTGLPAGDKYDHLRELFDKRPEIIAKELGFWQPDEDLDSAVFGPNDSLYFDSSGQLFVSKNGEVINLMDSNGNLHPYDGEMFDSDGGGSDVNIHDQPIGFKPESVQSIEESILKTDIPKPKEYSFDDNVKIVDNKIEINDLNGNVISIWDDQSKSVVLNDDFQFENTKNAIEARSIYNESIISLTLRDKIKRLAFIEDYSEYKNSKFSVYGENGNFEVYLNGKPIANISNGELNFDNRLPKYKSDLFWFLTGKSEWYKAFEYFRANGFKKIVQGPL